MAYTLIDKVSALTTLLDSLEGLRNSPPSLFVDLEGDNLSRHGTVSILQLYVQPEGHVYLIDVHRLGAEAFDTPNANGLTLRSVLESPAIPKVFFDVRNDSDALYSLFNVMLAGVDDLQLMELATRTFSKKRVNGLKRCIENDADMTWSEKQKWIKTKDEGHLLFDPKAGGSYAVFNERPLSDTVQKYCIQDVLHLPSLWRMYSARLRPMTRSKVHDATQARIAESQTSAYNGKGQHMALSPWVGWPESANPNPTITSDMHRHIKSFKLSSKTRSEAEKQVEAHNSKSTPLDLDMAKLALDNASVGVTRSDSDSAVKQERTPALSDQEAWRGGKVEGLTAILDGRASTKESGHKGSDLGDKAEQRVNTMVSDAFADFESRIGQGRGRLYEGGDESLYDDDYTDYDHGYSRGSESPTDFTACSADDCGYCGHCSY